MMCAAGTALAQQPPGGPGQLPPFLAEPMPLYKVGLGSFSRKISSSNAEAQAYFDQGFQLVYSFGKYDAIRSFREAWKRDPECAMCYWGEALAWGSNLNQVISAVDAPFAYAAAQKALSLKQRATPPERALIEALAHALRRTLRSREARRAGPAHMPGRWRRPTKRIPTISTSVRCTPMRCFTSSRARALRPDDARVCRTWIPRACRRIHEVLERLLARDPRHPGACHWYVHATEATAKVAAAQPCAEFLGKSIPGASHINHMPSHTFNEVGRWGDSVRANIEAWHSDLKAGVRRRLRHLPLAQPAHAGVCRLDGRSGRDRDACRARTTRSSRAATRCSRC